MDLKPFIDLGLSGAALGAMIYVIVSQMKLLRTMSDSLSRNNEILSGLKENIVANTEVTRHCTETTARQIEAQKDLVEFLKLRS